MVAPFPIPPSQDRRRQRQNPNKPEFITPPFSWATNRRAIVHSLEYLLSKGICTITGDVNCKSCGQQYNMGLDLQRNFMERRSFIVNNMEAMAHRAPATWMVPVLPRCRFCNNFVRPVIAEKKKNINWLFLFLGEMLGCCTLDQLKYFCKHTRNHRTGAKDRVLFLTYLCMCKQLEPSGPFDLGIVSNSIPGQARNH